jgi:hypothetical protein
VNGNKHKLLSETTFGHRVAEEEQEDLGKYFVETEEWKDIFSGRIDVVYGPKGSGKSALYSLLLKRADTLFDRGIIAVPAENLRGAAAFKDLVKNEPATEHEFVVLWKLYFLSLIGDQLIEYSATSRPATIVIDTLREAGLAKHEGLSAKLAAVMKYLKRLFSPESLSAELIFDPATGLPKGIGARITPQDATDDERAMGRYSVDQLLAMSNDALQEVGLTVWLLLDRLDFAFKDDPRLEVNALRTLFFAYLDMQALARISVKIFLRTDIWKRLVTDGFREASHITRERTISWDSASLLNLVIRRLIQNSTVCGHYAVNADEILGSTKAQRELFYRVFPQQVERTKDSPKTFDWVLLRTRDGSGESTPREVIHLFNQAREQQLKKLELGEREPDGDLLFNARAFADVFPIVSKARLEKTFFAEYPRLRYYVERLGGQKPSQTLESLATIWKASTDDTARIAIDLHDAGFFERQGGVATPTYVVPLLYRSALDM